MNTLSSSIIILNEYNKANVYNCSIKCIIAKCLMEQNIVNDFPPLKTHFNQEMGIPTKWRIRK